MYGRTERVVGMYSINCWLQPPYYNATLSPGKHTNIKKVIWRNHEGRWVNMMRSAGTHVIPFLPSVRFSQHSLGSRPTKQLASMGIPALLSWRPLPPFSISLPLSAAGPRREAAKFIFSTVVPLRWRRGPCHAAADVLGEGPWRDVGGTLLLLQHSILPVRWYLFALGKVRWASKCD